MKNTDDCAWFWTKLDQFLAANSLKQTLQRKQIIECFLKAEPHIDAERVYEEVREQHPAIGLATIYRTLNLLKEAGLVSQSQFRDGRVTYELKIPDTHHDHLICTRCETIIEFEDAEIEKKQEQIAKQHGFTLEFHRLDLYGICPKCV